MRGHPEPQGDVSKPIEAAREAPQLAPRLCPRTEPRPGLGAHSPDLLGGWFDGPGEGRA